MAFKMKGSPMKRNFGIGASPVKKEGVSKTKLTPKEIEARKKRKANMKAIREANPDDFELRKHGMPGEAKGGTWTHKKSGKTMKDYYDTGETLSTVEVKGKKSPATKKTSVLRPKIKGTNIKTVKVKKKKVKPAITEGVETESMQAYLDRTKKARGRKRALKNTGKKIVKGVKKFLSKK